MFINASFFVEQFCSLLSRYFIVAKAEVSNTLIQLYSVVFIHKYMLAVVFPTFMSHIERDKMNGISFQMQ